jgi:Spy/CpxP family protein refolding chaperone
VFIETTERELYEAIHDLVHRGGGSGCDGICDRPSGGARPPGRAQHLLASPRTCELSAHALKLSDAQRTQIRTLWQMERPTVSAHIHELLTENRKMNAIAVQANPDPGKVQEIADREATTIAALLVEKEQLQSKI